MDSELAEIKASILEIRDRLSGPLKSFLDKKIKKTEAYFEKEEPPSDIHIVYFKNCLDDAKKCKKIEKDFPCQRFACLTADHKLFDIFLYKLLSVCILDNPSGIDKIKDNIYRDIKEILENLLNNNLCQTYKTYQTRDSIKKNILELLILLLSKKEHVSFDKEYEEFFTHFGFLVNHNTINLNHYLDKIDKVESLNYFSIKNLTNIRQKSVAVIFSIDSSIIYRNLLANIEGIANSELSDQPALLRFINCFVFTLINKKKYFYAGLDENPNENLDLGVVLIYQALNRKCEQESAVSNVSFFNRLIKSSPKPTLGRQLSKFKQDYRDKIGKEFQWDVLSEGQVSSGTQVDSLPEEIAVYFSTCEINRSPKAVKEAVEIALQKYGTLELSEIQQAKPASIETINNLKGMGSKLFKAVQKGVGKFTEKTQIIIDDVSNKAIEVFEKGQGILEKGQEMKEDTIGFVKDAVNNFKWPVLTPEGSLSGLSNVHEKRLFLIRGKLETMASELYEIQSFLKERIDQARSSNRVVSYNAGKIYLHNEEFPHLEAQSEEIEKELNAIYISAIDKFKLEIENNIWFKSEKFSLKEWIKFFFTQGYFSVKLEKLKQLNRLDDKIDFKAEKDCFFKANFFALFHCGIIRWPWLSKENFATKWAEQVILLKIKEGSETTNENFSKASFLLEVLKIYHEVFSNLGKKDFFSELYPDINQASIKYLPELSRLFGKINSRIGSGAEADSPVTPEINLENTPNNTAFFNARNKEPEPTWQSSAKFGVTQNSF
ncbi:UvrD/REP helicase [Candidatus Rickettsiella viridis]|uniref:UvrD/REP helicase n=1 Tax=Candidatus Rickettsiella viridis TaxID=676208 RepID=A0A2Z5UXI5_9COXI|nr:hypothetical protein [Candidatus Rickettsiella viridis]BBB15891.1 UvrD/REP helicase [Candidatus Rickettsiella viridis]